MTDDFELALQRAAHRIADAGSAPDDGLSNAIATGSRRRAIKTGALGVASFFMVLVLSVSLVSSFNLRGEEVDPQIASDALGIPTDATPDVVLDESGQPIEPAVGVPSSDLDDGDDDATREDRVGDDAPADHGSSGDSPNDDVDDSPSVETAIPAPTGTASNAGGSTAAETGSVGSDGTASNSSIGASSQNGQSSQSPPSATETNTDVDADDTDADADRSDDDDSDEEDDDGSDGDPVASGGSIVQNQVSSPAPTSAAASPSPVSEEQDPPATAVTSPEPDVPQDEPGTPDSPPPTNTAVPSPTVATTPVPANPEPSSVASAVAAAGPTVGAQPVEPNTPLALPTATKPPVIAVVPITPLAEPTADAVASAVPAPPVTSVSSVTDNATIGNTVLSAVEGSAQHCDSVGDGLPDAICTDEDSSCTVAATGLVVKQCVVVESYPCVTQSDVVPGYAPADSSGDGNTDVCNRG